MLSSFDCIMLCLMLLLIIQDTARFGLIYAIAFVFWNLTHNSDSQSANMLLERRDNPYFNVVLSMTTATV